MALGFVENLLIESWTLYSLGMLLIIARLFSRRLKLGTWKLQVEDWLMVFASANFTGVVVSVNEVAANGSSYMPLEVALSLSPKEHDMAVYGSKMTLVLEVFTITCLWTIKACLLMLYWRLTTAFRKQQLAVKLIAGYCVIGYILVMSLCLGYWCHPIEEYWAVPVRISQCATYYHHMMFATAWNISSDLALFFVPIPVIAKSQLPLKRKILLCFVLGLGLFNIVIAVLNRYYNFHNVDDLGYVYFYVAEVATAVYVGNIPLCWPLFRRLVHGSAWSRDGSSGKTDDPNQPRTRTHSRFSKKRLNSSSLWTITRGGNTEWDKMDEEADSSKERVYRNELGVVQEDQSSTIELTPGWHHEAHSTTIHASRSRSPGSQSGDHTQDKDNIQVNITRTVEISTAEARHSYGHQTPHGI